MDNDIPLNAINNHNELSLKSIQKANGDNDDTDDIDEEETSLTEHQHHDWRFNSNFWDEKIRGYELLCQNLRNSLTSIREFERYIRECAFGEDQYIKQLNKQTSQIEKFLTDSTMSPIWCNCLRDLNDQNSWSHLHFMNRLCELSKALRNYYEEVRRKKRKIKENETKTIQLIESFKSSKQQLNKCKEQYHHAFSEAEKMRQTLETTIQQTPQNQSSITSINSSIAKLEKKLTAASDEYKSSIDKFNQIKTEFQQRFIDSCDSFQLHEENHLNQMRGFLFTYLQSLDNLNISRQKNYSMCKTKIETKYVVEYLIEKFVSAKGTGQVQPSDAEFVEYSSNSIYGLANGSLSPSSPKYMDARADPIYYNQNGDNVNEIERSGDYSLNNSLNDTTASRRRSDSSRFSLFNIDFRGRREKFKKANSANAANATSIKNQTYISTSFEPAPSTSSSINPSNSSLNNHFELNNNSSLKMIEKTFDQQLVHLNSFEQELKEKNNISSSELTPSNNDGLMQSYSLNLSSSKNNFYPNERRPVSGSLITAVSLENYFYDRDIKARSNSNYSNRNDFIIDNNNEIIDVGIGEANDLNYFPAFDDLDLFDKTNVMSSSKTNDPSNFFDSRSQSNTNEENQQKAERNLKKLNNSNSFGNNYMSEIDHSDDSDFSDDSDDSDVPKKILVKINPIDQSNPGRHCVSPDVLSQVTRNLQLNLPVSNFKERRNANKQQQSINNTNGLDLLDSNNNILGKNDINNQPSMATSIASVTNASTSTSPSLLSPRSDSSTSFVNNFNNASLSKFIDDCDDDENTINNSQIVNLSKSPDNTNAPPLPPLPVNLQQKVKEKQALFDKHKKQLQLDEPLSDNREVSKNEAQSVNQHHQNKSEPIQINNGNVNTESVSKIVRQNSFRYLQGKSFEAKDAKIENTKINQSNNITSYKSMKLTNMRIPGEDEMKF